MIDRANSADGLAIQTIAAKVGVFSPEEVDCVQDLWNDFQREGDESGYIFLVYRDAQRLLGFACYGPTPMTHGTYDFYWLAVDPDTHGRGVGRALLNEVERDVLHRGGHLLLIETSSTPAYAAARRLYENAGCTREALIHDFYALGDDLVLYSKHLS
jgi:ribosomal protein S18 acetylase RimI-like enzyme